MRRRLKSLPKTFVTITRTDKLHYGVHSGKIPKIFQIQSVTFRKPQRLPNDLTSSWPRIRTLRPRRFLVYRFQSRPMFR